MRQNPPLILSQAEKIALIDLNLNGKRVGDRRRAYAILRIGEGIKKTQIAEECQVTKMTIYDWLFAWQTEGISGLIKIFKGGRKKSIDENIGEVMLNLASNEGLSAGEILEKTKVICELSEPPCSVDTVRSFLKENSMTYKRARASLKKKK